MDRQIHIGILVFALGAFVATVAPASAQSPAEGDIIISEIMHSPDGPDTDREYVEVFNTTNRTIDLKNWVLIEGDPSGSNTPTDDINESVPIAPGSFAVLCENPDGSENGGVSCAYDYANGVDHTGREDYVGLSYNGTQIDLVHYDEENGWPGAFDASIEYVGPIDGDNSVPQNWEKATTRAGDFAGSVGNNDGSPNADAPDGSLPVELARFQASANGETVRLVWTTASESGNAGFAVQHRSGSATDWARLGFVDGAGTTTAAQSYRFVTDPLAAGPHTFRLKQVDTDGSVHYSAPTRVQVQPGVTLSLDGPNPLSAGESVRVRLRTPRSQSARLVLYNILGQRVQTFSAGTKGPAGGIQARLSGDELASGTYILQVEGDVRSETRRLTVVR